MPEPIPEALEYGLRWVITGDIHWPVGLEQAHQEADSWDLSEVVVRRRAGDWAPLVTDPAAAEATA